MPSDPLPPPPPPPVESYQNGRNTELDSLLKDDADHDPQVELERGKKNRLCFLLMLFSILLALTAGLAVWNAHRRGPPAPENWSQVASQAHHRLNKHLHSQSKRISPGCESTVIIIRHCEKYGPFVPDEQGNQHCSYLGLERSAYLATLFGTRWPKPSQLYALTPERDGYWNFREWETLEPLSKQSGVPIQIAERQHVASNFFDLLHSGDLCGKVTVFCWKHDWIPELAAHLGCSDAQGCPDDYPHGEYDQTWQLKYVFHPSEPDDFRKGESDLVPGRRLSTSSKQGGWAVYGSVTQQHFDALAHSYDVGDYPEGGVRSGGRWQVQDL